MGLWSSYDVGTDVAVREVSKASFNKLAIENARSVSGPGDIEADQSYSGSGGYTGEATFGTSGSGSLTSSASLTPASMNAYQSAFASGSSNVGMGITNEGTARLDYNLESGSMKAEQSISTGSARASGSVLFNGATGSSWTEASSPSQGSASIFSSYALSEGVSAIERSTASSNQVELTNSRYISGSGDIDADQSYSGSGGYTGEATFGTSGSGSLTSSASLTPASMDAYQSAFASGSSNGLMGITNEGTAEVKYNLLSGYIEANQKISTGSAYGSQNIQGYGVLDASVSGTYIIKDVTLGASVVDGALSTSQEVAITNPILSNQIAYISGSAGGVHGYALGQENYIAVNAYGHFEGVLESNLQSVADTTGTIAGNVLIDGFECISDESLKGMSSGTMAGSTVYYPAGIFETTILNSYIHLGQHIQPEVPMWGLLGFKWYETNPSIQFYVNSESKPHYLTLDAVLREANTAVNVWDSATTRQLFVPVLELPESLKDPNDPNVGNPGTKDDINAIGWGDSTGVAHARWWAGTNDDDGHLNPNAAMGIMDLNRELLKVYEADITFSSSQKWRTDDSNILKNILNYDLQTVLIHELGHILGLKDLYVKGDVIKYGENYDRIYPKIFEKAVKDQVMYGYGNPWTTKHSLAAGDIAGIQYLYPDLLSGWLVNPGELIQDYINKASSGDTITISPGTFYENLVIDKSITLQGAGNSETGTVIDGSSLGSVISINRGGIPNLNIIVNLVDLVIRSGLSSHGGGIYNLGNLNIESCTITDNEAHVGGGIFTAGSTTIEDSVISSNKATSDVYYGLLGNGGGIFNDYGQVTIKGSTTISENTAADHGGGVYNGYGAVLKMERGTISDNTASNEDHCGGGGVLNAGIFTMNSGDISRNSAGSGGGVMNTGTFTMNGGIISENRATKNRWQGEGGGGVHNAGTFTINGGTISKNVAIGSGGGIYSTGTFMMNEGTISGNSANNGAGGGVHTGLSRWHTSGTFTMIGGTISENDARVGGGVALWGESFTMNGGAITGNKGASGGGGIYAGNTESTYTMNGGTISGNSATSGSGGGIGSIGNIIINGGTISGNSAKLDGGGIYQPWVFGRLSIGATSQIIDNKAEEGYGGGIYSGSNSVTFDGTNAVIKSNKAKLPSPSESSWYQGWGIYLKEGIPIISNGFDPAIQVTDNKRILNLPGWEEI